MGLSPSACLRRVQALEAAGVIKGYRAILDRTHLGVDTPDALASLASLPEADVVLNAVVGFAGLPATLAALTNGKRLALANKESLIAGGPVVAKERGSGGGEIVPVDSEHSAIYQVLRAGAPHEVRRILLTASGGPFRGKSRAELERVTVADALKHPTWTMGAKITIDSSTLMNKGLEVIEAHELFGVDFDHVDVVVHPQSIVHGMVEFTDGATVAQLSQPPTGSTNPSAPSTGPASGRSPSRPPISTRSRASASPMRRVGPAAAPLRPSAPPTRSRSRRSSGAGSRGWASPPWSRT